MAHITASEVRRFLDSLNDLKGRFKVKDLVKTWVVDGPKIGIVIENLRRTSGTSYVILVDGEIYTRHENYVVDLAEECPEYSGSEKFTMPIIRQVFPLLMTNEIVSVQPMTMPKSTFKYLSGASDDKEDDQT